MPFHINPKGDEFEVVDDAGKSYGVHKTRQQAIDQQKALYANVLEAKETSDEMDIWVAEWKEYAVKVSF